MKRLRFGLMASLALSLFGSNSASAQFSKKEGTTNSAAIQWYATLDRGLAEAKRTGKPILFVSAAPHCAGVSGMW
jgi:hypothetical protein